MGRRRPTELMRRPSRASQRCRVRTRVASQRSAEQKRPNLCSKATPQPVWRTSLRPRLRRGHRENCPSSKALPRQALAVRCFEEVVAENDGNCTFESCPAKSSAAVTWETQVTEATDGQSVFENQPKQSGAHARSGAEGGCSDSEYTTDDSEDEN